MSSPTVVDYNLSPFLIPSPLLVTPLSLVALDYRLFTL
jgi:hypothetical protein